MILTVHNRELVLSRYQATQLCLIQLSLSLNHVMKAVNEGEECQGEVMAVCCEVLNTQRRWRGGDGGWEVAQFKFIVGRGE